jgi:hypothetical protein
MPFRQASHGVSCFFLFEALRAACDDLAAQQALVTLARDKAEGLLIRETPARFESLLQDVCCCCFSLSCSILLVLSFLLFFFSFLLFFFSFLLFFFSFLFSMEFV